MAKKELKVVGISNSNSQTGAFALVLGEKDSNMRIPIIIGAYEAQAIALHLENLAPSRPLTHDLFASLFVTFQIILEEVFINKFHEGIFYSTLICEKDGKTVEIDSRTSDAIALAIRLNAPIFCNDDIINKTAVSIDSPAFQDDTDEPEDIVEGDKSELTIDELKLLLEDAIKEENYEEASRIRDLINKQRKP